MPIGLYKLVFLFFAGGKGTHYISNNNAISPTGITYNIQMKPHLIFNLEKVLYIRLTSKYKRFIIINVIKRRPAQPPKK